MTNNNKINQGFILAAGKGTRMRPITDTIPKPMVEIAGRSLILRAIDECATHGMSNVVVNTHYKADILKGHLAPISAPQIHFSDETELLETGGGLKRGLKLLDQSQPVFIVSGDALWTNRAERSAITHLESLWDDSAMDILMLLQPTQSMTLTHGVGDYDVNEKGQCIRALDQNGTHMFTSLRIVHPRIFENTPDGAFSFLDLMDQAQDQGRLYGAVHDADWHHISTPQDLDALNAAWHEGARSAAS